MTGKISEDPDKVPITGSEKLAAASGGNSYGVLISSIANYLASLPQTLTGKTLDSPALINTPTAPTAPVHSNSSMVANTAYVDAAILAGGGGGAPPATVPPLMDGVAAVGIATKYAREDHVHPTDASRAASSHSHVAADVTDFSEAVDDRVGALLVAGTNITLTYNDPANTLTITSTASGGGGGDVVGPSGAVADRIATFNGTTGKVIKDSGTLISALQPSDAELSAIAGLTSAADRLPYFTGSGTASLATFTIFARSLVDDIDAATARGTLGLSAAATATPAALTKTDDTNVTLTLGGTPATALLQATSITLGWTGALATARGGFGADISAQSGVALFATGVATFTGTTGTGNFARADSPTFTGNPTAPTPTAGDNDTSVATTAFVATAVAAGGGGGSSAVAADDILINGDMDFSQRILTNNTPLTNAAYVPTLDCWRGIKTGTMAANIQQGALAALPGYSSVMVLTIPTAQASLGSNDQVSIQQPIEVARIQRLQWGTAGASPVTLSFWSCHHRTGLYSGTVTDGAGANGVACYAFTYNQNVADAWEFKTVSIPGPTIGTWTATATAAARVNFAMAAGSGVLTTPGVWAATGGNVGATGQINGVAATSDVFRITGVRMMPGSNVVTAANASLLRLPFDAVFQQVRRFYQKNVQYNVAPVGGNMMETDFPSTTGRLGVTVQLLPPMRSSPTVIVYDTTGAGGMCYKGGDGKVAGVAGVTPTIFLCYTNDSTNSGFFAFNFTADASVT